MKVAIIGAGIAGIATAVRLASGGMEVSVFEANDYPGGKLSTFTIDGFRFDAGPSLFTMPHYVEALFAAADEEVQAHFQYEKLSVVCNYFWEDGTRLSAHADADRFAEEVEKQLGVSPKTLFKALKDSEKKYELTGAIFLENSLHRATTWLRGSVVKALLQLPKLDIFRSMNEVNERNLQHPKLVQLFNRFATYNGSNPYKASGILNIIPYFEHKIGAFFPKGGMHSITDSLYQLAQRKGVHFHFGKKVQQIQVQAGKATGIELEDGQALDFDLVVSNMDVFFTYKKLLPRQKHPQRTLKQQKSTSALIFYWGVRRKFPELDLHNIFFSDDYKKEFDLLEAGKVSDDPTVYINISSKYCPEDAPEACENWFTMVNVPFDAGQDWDAIIERTRVNVLEKVSRILGVDIRPLIVCEEILDPRSIESKTSSHLGALYGTSSNDRMSAFLRHANFSSKITNLYFCGGSVHPGGGIPLCLLSAKIVSELIAKKYQLQPSQ